MSFIFQNAAGSFLLGFPSLFSIINPIGSAIIFFDLTGAQSHSERAILARRIAAWSLLVLVVSLLAGSYVLGVFGISISALRVGGGLIVAVQAWGLLSPLDRSDEKRSETLPGAGEIERSSFFPLTVPLTVGPGSVSVAIALASQRPPEATAIAAFYAGLALAALANALIIWRSYVWADRVVNMLGETGARVVSRLAAFILLCIGVQILGTGLRGFLT